ncbi:diphthamide synthesis protein [Candidatus Woesearchaeota archaeon]|nr:diphthamide synthesis protein [Candidatus Woesearchaeota archaeon]
MQTPKYDLELESVIVKIKEENARLVCIQLPDGLKPYAGDIQDAIRQKTGAGVIIWAGSCFGACDVPLEVSRLGVDLLVQWGHSEWR